MNFEHYESNKEVPAMDLEAMKKEALETAKELQKDPHDLSPLNRFLDKYEPLAATARDQLELNISTAEIYRDAGMTEEALDAFDKAAEYAYNMYADDKYEAMLQEISKLEENR